MRRARRPRPAPWRRLSGARARPCRPLPAASRPSRRGCFVVRLALDAFVFAGGLGGRAAFGRRRAASAGFAALRARPAPSPASAGSAVGVAALDARVGFGGFGGLGFVGLRRRLRRDRLRAAASGWPHRWPGLRPAGAPGRGRSRSGRRWPSASNRRIEPATAALSEPIAPRIGIRTNRSHRRRTAGDRPWPSLPTTSASGPRRSASRAVSDASASEPTIRRPRRWRSVSVAARSSTGTRSRCSVAPADALTAAGDSGAWRSSGTRRRGRPRPRRCAAACPTFWGPRASRARGRTAARRARSPGPGCRRPTRTGEPRRRPRRPGGRRSRRATSASRPRPRRSGCAGSWRGGRSARAPGGAAA